jgi:hypothetical protein
MQLYPEEHPQAIVNARREPKRSTPREVIAAILFDTLTQPIADARGATDARQVVMRAEEFDIHLKISANPAQHQIIGQVFARDEIRFLSPVRLQLLLDEKPVRTTWTDNFGQFQFDEVPEGVVRLKLDLPHLTIVSEITISDRFENQQLAPSSDSDGQ